MIQPIVVKFTESLDRAFDKAMDEVFSDDEDLRLMLHAAVKGEDGKPVLTCSATRVWNGDRVPLTISMNIDILIARTADRGDG